MKFFLKTLVVAIFLCGTYTMEVLANQESTDTRDYRNLATITDPYPENERGFLRYTSHPSERLLAVYRETKGKISLCSEADLITIQASERANELFAHEEKFIFDFSGSRIEIADADTENFPQWFTSSDPELLAKNKSLKDVVSDVLAALENLAQEQIAESSLTAQTLLQEAHSSRTPEKASDFKIAEANFFSDGDVEINLTDVIEGAKSNFFFAQNIEQLEDLLRALPTCTAYTHYFLLGYRDFHGFYSAHCSVIPSLEITAKKNLVYVKEALNIPGNISLHSTESLLCTASIKAKHAQFISHHAWLIFGSIMIRCYHSGDKKLVFSKDTMSYFENTPEILPGLYQFLCDRYDASGIILTRK